MGREIIYKHIILKKCYILSRKSSKKIIKSMTKPKARWKSKMEAGRRRKRDTLISKYGTKDGLLKGLGIASLLGVIGFSAKYIPYQGLLEKFRSKGAEHQPVGV